VIQESLFTRDFLPEGITETDAWQALDDSDVGALKDHLSTCFANILTLKHPNETETENTLIWPVLETLGWDNWLPQ
jgi:hypothetical protein